MGAAIVGAAKEAGIRLTLLDACYLHGGIGVEVAGAQVRFSDGSADAWARRAGELADGPGVRIGAAIHSVRAVDPDSARVVADWARERGAPLHAHVSEQRAENEDCVGAYGVTPTALLERCGALSKRFTAVHATHLTGDDVALLGGAGGACCVCPTTERDLADGIGDASALRDAGARLSLGSDSQAVIDLFEEARAVEIDERLATGERGRHRAVDLLTAATKGGYSCLGWPEGGSLSPGAPADLVRVDLGGVRRGPRGRGPRGPPWLRRQPHAPGLRGRPRRRVRRADGRHAVRGGRHPRDYRGDARRRARRAAAPGARATARSAARGNNAP